MSRVRDVEWGWSVAALSVRDHAVLRFADRQYAHPGRRASDMLEELGMNETRYAARLNYLIDLPESEVAYPRLVRRLSRLRDGRRSERSARRAS